MLLVNYIYIIIKKTWQRYIYIYTGAVKVSLEYHSEEAAMCKKCLKLYIDMNISSKKLLEEYQNAYYDFSIWQQCGIEKVYIEKLFIIKIDSIHVFNEIDHFMLNGLTRCDGESLSNKSKIFITNYCPQIEKMIDAAFEKIDE